MNAVHCLGHIAAIFASVLAVFFSGAVSAQDYNRGLNNTEIYYRCFTSLTRSRPTANDPFLPQIAANQITGVAACQQLLELSRFAANNQLPPYASGLPADNERQRISRSILSNIHSLHIGWFSNDKTTFRTTCEDSSTMALYSTSEPALHFTRSFFDGDFGFDRAVTTSDVLHAERRQGEPPTNVFISASSKADSYKAMYGWNIRYAEVGTLLGINPETAMVLPTGYRLPMTNPAVAISSHDTMKSYGGGVIGSPAFLLHTVQNGSDVVSDVEKLPRKWAKEVFKTLLCRDLPLVKAVDALPYTVCSTAAGCGCAADGGNCGIVSSVPVLPFRSGNSCVRCHASMDQLASVARGFRYLVSKQNDCNTTEGNIPTTHVYHNQPGSALNLSAVGGAWPAQKNATYWDTPANGKLYYRDYRNNLVNVPIASVAGQAGLSALGQQIASSDDYYLCATKRYFEFLTGISCNISPMTTVEDDSLDATELRYRNLCIELMTQFKGVLNKDPMELMQAIMQKPEYIKRNFGVGE